MSGLKQATDDVAHNHTALLAVHTQDSPKDIKAWWVALEWNHGLRFDRNGTSGLTEPRIVLHVGRQGKRGVLHTKDKNQDEDDLQQNIGGNVRGRLSGDDLVITLRLQVLVCPVRLVSQPEVFDKRANHRSALGAAGRVPCRF